MILIRRRPDGIVGVITPPHANALWLIETPISQEDFCEGMVERGSRPVDVMDVLAESTQSEFGYIQLVDVKNV